MSYNSGVILNKGNNFFQPEDTIKSKNDTRSQTIYVDSRDRYYNNYPNSNEYIVDLAYGFKDVISLELISADIPKTQYNVHSNNNTLYLNKTNGASDADLKVKSNYTAVTIDVGNYSSSDLVTALQTKIRAFTGTNATVTLDAKTQKLSLGVLGADFRIYLNDSVSSSTGATKLEPTSGSLANMLGFSANTQYISASGASLAASGSINMNGENYIVLKIDNIDRTEGSNNTFRGAFAKLSVADKSYGDIKQLKVSDFGAKCIEVFNPYLGRLNKLKLSFYNHDGTLYDFNGAEHCLAFEVRTLYRNNNY